MSYDLVICECACGNRVAFPATAEATIDGYSCDVCYLRFRFDDTHQPLRVSLGDDDGGRYPLGLRVYSLIRDNGELAQDLLGDWMAPPRREELPATGTDG